MIPAKKFRNGGFTVIELLVAAAITLVVLGLMLQVTFSVLKTFDKVTGSLSTKTQATTALEYLRRDFNQSSGGGMATSGFWPPCNRIKQAKGMLIWATLNGAELA